MGGPALSEPERSPRMIKKKLPVLALALVGVLASFTHTLCSAEFRAGAATSNITPDLGGDIVGGFVPVPATHVHDELHARCLVLDDGVTKLALVVCDLLGMHRSVFEEAKKLIQDATGIPPSHVLISATHTHSATNALGEKVRPFASDIELTEYQRFVARRVSDGVRRAVHLMRPAEIGFVSVDAPEHVFVRRWFMREGTVPVNPFGTIDRVKMNPAAGSADLLEPAGQPDPGVSVMAVREPGGRLIAVYSAYSLHYVGGVGAGHVSADYFGMYCEALKKMQGDGAQQPPFVAMMANGTSGDVNNINFKSPRPRMEPYEQMRRVAEDLATKVSAGLSKVEWKKTAKLDARQQVLPVRWRSVDAELLQWAAKTEAAATAETRNSLPVIYAGRIQRLANASPEAKAPAQVLRIGDICIGTSPCETFSETGLEFKRRSPFAHSFMVELAGGYYGYLPTPRHFELGGYETWPGTNYLEAQAAPKLMETLLGMAAALRDAGGR